MTANNQTINVTTDVAYKKALEKSLNDTQSTLAQSKFDRSFYKTNSTIRTRHNNSSILTKNDFHGKPSSKFDSQSAQKSESRNNKLPSLTQKTQSS